MTLQRQTNPLPDGRYWIDVQGANIDAFNGWLSDNKEGVHVEVTEQDTESDPPQAFYIFTTKTRVTPPGGTASINVPIDFDAVKFGFPTIAPANIKSKADTVQKPDPPKNPLDNLDKTLSQVGGFIALGLGIVLFGFIAENVAKHKKGD